MSAPSVGLLGCGPWGRLILRDLVALGAEVYVWSPGAESREVARHGGARAVHTEIGHLPHCDGFVLAVSAAHHTTCIEAVAERGVPVFVEKPMCCNADEARRLVEQFGDRLFVMDKWRYHNGVLLLAELARSGELGSIVGMHTTRIGYADSHSDADAAWTLAPHDLSIALEVFGGVSTLSQAHGHVDHRSQVRTLAATFTDDQARWLTVHVSDRSPIDRREVHLVGTDGSALLGGGYADHVHVRRGPHYDQRAFTPNMPLEAELSVFLDHLRGGPAPRSSAAEAATSVRLIAEARLAVGADR